MAQSQALHSVDQVQEVRKGLCSMGEEQLACAMHLEQEMQPQFKGRAAAPLQMDSPLLAERWGPTPGLLRGARRALLLAARLNHLAGTKTKGLIQEGLWVMKFIGRGNWPQHLKHRLLSRFGQTQLLRTGPLHY